MLIFSFIDRFSIGGQFSLQKLRWTFQKSVNWLTVKPVLLRDFRFAGVKFTSPSRAYDVCSRWAVANF